MFPSLLKTKVTKNLFLILVLLIVSKYLFLQLIKIVPKNIENKENY